MSTATLSHTFLERQKSILLAANDRLKGRPGRYKPEEQFRMGDIGDAGTFLQELDDALSMVRNRDQTLSDIAIALRKLEIGTYGVCEHSGLLISEERLEAIPWVRYTIEVQMQIETNRIQVKAVSMDDLFSDKKPADSGEDDGEDEIDPSKTPKYKAPPVKEEED